MDHQINRWVYELWDLYRIDELYDKLTEIREEIKYGETECSCKKDLYKGDPYEEE